MKVRRLARSLWYCCIFISACLTHVEAAPTVVEHGYRVSTVARVTTPTGIAMDSHGNLFVGTGGHGSREKRQIQKVTPCGAVTNFGPIMRDPDPVLIDEFDNVYVGTRKTGIMLVAPDETARQFVNGGLYPYKGEVEYRLFNIEGLAWDPQGNIIAASYEGSIARITRQGEVTILTDLDFSPACVACTPCGKILIGTRGLGKVISFDPTNQAFSVLAEGIKIAWGIAIEPFSGDIFISDPGDTYVYGDGRLFKLTANGKLSIFAVGFDDPTAIFFDGKGNLFVTDVIAQTITRIEGFPTPTLIELTVEICPRILRPLSKLDFVTRLIPLPRVFDNTPSIRVTFRRPVRPRCTGTPPTPGDYRMVPPSGLRDYDININNKRIEIRFKIKSCRRATTTGLPSKWEVPPEMMDLLPRRAYFRVLERMKDNPRSCGR